MLQPKIKDSFPIVYNNLGDISIGNKSGFSFIISRPPAWVGYCLSLCDGKKSIPRIISMVKESFPNTRENVISLLFEKLMQITALEDMSIQKSLLTEEELRLYHRQMLGFSLLEQKGHQGLLYQQLLKEQRVLVFGVGGWGSWITINLTLSGFGNIILVDGDTVELSNLSRQVLYNHNDIGKPKVLAAKDNLKTTNPYVAVSPVRRYVTTKDEKFIESLMEGVTLIFISWANLGYFTPDTVSEVIHFLAFKKEIPIMEVGAGPSEVTVGPIFTNNKLAACFNCVRNKASRLFAEDQRIRDFQELHLTKFNSQVHPQTTTSLSIMSGIAIDQAIKLITGIRQSSLISKEFKITLNDLSVQTKMYPQDINCTWCGNR